MRNWLVVLLGLVAAQPLPGQQASRPPGLDSGAVVRLHWAGGSEKGSLLAPLAPESAEMQYCLYPSPVCGTATHNPPRTRALADLTRVDVRRGSRAGHGARVGALVGTIGGLLYLLGQGLSDAPALSSSQQVGVVAVLAGTWSAFGALVGAASDDWKRVR